MFLLDSSAWIEYLRPAGDPAVKARVRGVLEREEACCCGVVMVEVLRGAKREKDFHLLEELLLALPQLPLDEAAAGRAGRWGFALARTGVPVSTTDLLIAAAAHNRAVVLHRDGDFRRIAEAGALKEEMI